MVEQPDECFENARRVRNGSYLVLANTFECYYTKTYCNTHCTFSNITCLCFVDEKKKSKLIIILFYMLPGLRDYSRPMPKINLNKIVFKQEQPQ